MNASSSAAALFAIRESNCPDKNGGALFWNFTAWRADHPERLLTYIDAQRELARLRASLPHAADRMHIVNVVAIRERNAHFGAFRRAALAAVGYDELEDGPTKRAVGRAAVALAKARADAEIPF